jgi:hypothetical protein
METTIFFSQNLAEIGVALTAIGVVFTGIATYFTVLNYFKDDKGQRR